MVHIVEIKAKCQDLHAIRSLLKAENAVYHGLDHQVDTYFNVSNGRLKLREGNIENNLIHYFRENIRGPKYSEVSLFRSEPKSTLKQILTNAVGIIAVVDKQREIYFIDHVKFHLDKVKDLGTFVEIEAIDETGQIDRKSLQKHCERYLELFDIPESDLIPVSYSDLILST
jgi:predicted adenylyl cyclase CyaB